MGTSCPCVLYRWESVGDTSVRFVQVSLSPNRNHLQRKRDENTFAVRYLPYRCDKIHKRCTTLCFCFVFIVAVVVCKTETNKNGYVYIDWWLWNQWSVSVHGLVVCVRCGCVSVRYRGQVEVGIYHYTWSQQFQSNICKDYTDSQQSIVTKRCSIKALCLIHPCMYVLLSKIRQCSTKKMLRNYETIFLPSSLNTAAIKC